MIFTLFTGQTSKEGKLWLGHKNYTTTLIYAYADTEAKRIAIGKAMTNGIDPVTVTEKTYAATDEETIKKLYRIPHKIRKQCMDTYPMQKSLLWHIPNPLRTSTFVSDLRIQN